MSEALSENERRDALVRMALMATGKRPAPRGGSVLDYGPVPEPHLSALIEAWTPIARSEAGSDEAQIISIERFGIHHVVTAVADGQVYHFDSLAVY